MTDKEIPTYTTDGKGVIFCPKCKRKHFHSEPDGEEAEHRVAHCHHPMRHPRGYFIKSRAKQ